MKKVFSTIALLASAMMVSAAPRTAEDALKMARQFVASTPSLSSLRTMKLTLSNSITSKAKSRSGEEKETTPAYYVVNIEDNKGFVLISGDDRFEPVLGYSTSGNLPEDGQLPDGLNYWLGFLADEMNAAIDNGYEPVAQAQRRASSAALQSVEPLIKTKWGQKQPYNNKISNFATGCVATGMAQVMKYWSYPKQGTGSHTHSISGYSNYSADFGATIYEWDKMLNQYGVSNFPFGDSKESIDAVSTLMYHLGVATDMRWTADNSGTPNMYSAYALIHYFGYNKYLYAENRDQLSTGAWKALIIDQLSTGHPLCYAGMTEESGGMGHYFVLDGYDANTGLFHFNWGWDGHYDGYFNISSLAPGGEGEAGALTGSYNYGQQMFVNVQPTEVYNPTARFDATEVKPRLKEFAGRQVIMQTYNLGNTTVDFKGTIGLAIYNLDGTLKSYVPSDQAFPGPLGLGSNYNGLAEFSVILSDLQYGTYNVCLAVQNENYPDKLFPVRPNYGNPSMYTMTLKKGAASVNANDVITFDAITPNYNLECVSAPVVNNSSSEAVAYENVPATFKLKVKNTGTTEYYDEVGVCIQRSNRDSQRQYITVPCQLAPGEEKEVMVRGTILRAPGTYSLVGCYTLSDAYITFDDVTPITIMDEASAIESVSTSKADNTIYTLGGLRVDSKLRLTKGIYIQNGKKIIIK